MATVKSDIANLNKAELIAYAQEKFNLDLDESMTNADMKDEILREAEEMDAKGLPDKSKQKKRKYDEGEFVQPHLLMDDRVLVMFRQTSGPDGHLPVKVGINGREILIPRDKEVAMPRKVLESLDTNITRGYKQEKIDGKYVNVARDIKRFPYEVIKDPAP